MCIESKICVSIFIKHFKFFFICYCFVVWLSVVLKKNVGHVCHLITLTEELHYPKAFATKAAQADDVAEVRLNPVFQRTGAIQTRQTGFVHSYFRESGTLDARTSLSRSLIPQQSNNVRENQEPKCRKRRLDNWRCVLR